MTGTCLSDVVLMMLRARVFCVFVCRVRERQGGTKVKFTLVRSTLSTLSFFSFLGGSAAGGAEQK